MCIVIFTCQEQGCIISSQGFRAAAAQQLKELPKEADADLTKLRQAATIIYDQYIADKVSSDHWKMRLW